MRMLWVDILKAFLIFLVMLAHAIPDSFLKHYIYSVPIPLFFFLSGYLYNKDKYDFAQFFKKKVRTIAIPYLFFAVLSFLFWLLVVRNLSVGGRALAMDPLKSLIGVLYGVGSGEWRIPMNIPLWFLPSLFVVEMGFYFVRSAYLLPVFAALGYLASLLPFRLPWGSDVALTGIVFYGIGHFCKDSWTSHKALPLLLAVHLGFCFLNSRVDMNYLLYGNVFYFYVSAISGVMFYSSLFRLIKKSVLLAYIGRNTLTILGMMGISSFMMNGILYVLLGAKLEQTGFGFALGASVLQLALTVPAIYCINTWMPFILGKPRPHKKAGIRLGPIGVQ